MIGVAVNADALAQFERDGYIACCDLFSPIEIGAFQALIPRVFTENRFLRRRSSRVEARSSRPPHRPAWWQYRAGSEDLAIAAAKQMSRQKAKERAAQFAQDGGARLTRRTAPHR